MEVEDEFYESIRMLEELSLTASNYHLSDHRHDAAILRLLLRAKSGNRSAMHELESRAREFGELSLFHTVFLLTRSSTRLSFEERRNLQQVFDALLPLLGDIVRSHARILVQSMTPQLISSDPLDNEVARYVVCSLCSCGSVDLEFMTDLVTPDIFSSNTQYKRRAVQILTAMASSLGIAPVIPFLTNLCSHTNHGRIREVGYKVVQQTAMVVGRAIIPHLSELVRILSSEMVIEHDTWAVWSAASAIDSLARAVNQYQVDSFGWEVPRILKCTKSHLSRGWMRSVEACAKAIGSIIELSTEPMKSVYAKELMEVVCSKVFVSGSLDGEERSERMMMVMEVYEQCLRAEGVSDLDVDGWLSEERVFKSYWTKFRELNHEDCSILLDVTIEIAKKIGVSEVLERASKGIVEGAGNPYMQKVMPEVSKAVVSSVSRASSDNAEFDDLVLKMRGLCSLS